MERATWRLSVVFTLVTTGWICTADSLASAKPASPAEVAFSDDFRADTRSQYEITGSVAWETGKLSLGSDATIRKRMDIGPLVELTVDLHWPSLKKDGQTSHTEIGLELEGDSLMSVILVRKHKHGKTVGEVRVVRTRKVQAGNPNSVQTKSVMDTIRTFSELPDFVQGSLNVGYCYGLLHVSMKDHPVACGYVPLGTRSVEALVVSSVQGNVFCDKLSLTGCARRAPLTVEQQAAVAELRRLAAQAHKMEGDQKVLEGIRITQKVVALAREVFGDESYQYGLRLFVLAAMYSKVHQHDEALPLYAKSREILEKSLGKKHPEYAFVLNNLAVLYQEIRKYAEAERLFRQALRIRRDVYGVEDAEFAMGLNNLAALYCDMDRYDQAEPLYEQTLVINKNVFGEAHPRYADSLTNLGSVYLDLGKHSHAEQLFLQACEVRKKVHDDPLGYARTLDYLAGLYRILGRYREAEPRFRAALRLRENVLGKKDLSYSHSLNNLGELYIKIGEYAKSEILLLSACDIRRELLGEKHPLYATALGNLGALYLAMGEFRKAESRFLQVCEIRRDLYPKQPLGCATSLNNLASLYWAMEEYAKAKPLYLQALDIVKESRCEKHHQYREILNNLALVYQDMGELAKADQALSRAITIAREVYREESPEYALYLNNLGALYIRPDHYTRAEPLLRRALAIRKRVLGEDHFDYAVSLHNLGTLYEAKREYAKAASFLRQALDAYLRITRRTLRWLPEAQAGAYLRRQGLGRDYLLSSFHKLPDKDAAEAYRAVWESRAMVTQMLAARRHLLRDSPEARDLYTRLQTVQRELAQLALALLRRKAEKADHKRLAELENRKEELERRLAKLSNEFRRSLRIREADWSDLAALLPKNTAVVSVVEARIGKARTEAGPLQAERHYEAFVLRNSTRTADPTVVWECLGPAGPVDKAIDAWRASMRLDTAEDQAAPEKVPPQKVLRERIWNRIESHLKGCTTVVIIPDGDLCFLPWSALPGRKPGSYLIEDYSIATASDGRQLYRVLSEPSTPKGNLLLVGGVSYDDPPSETSPPVSTMAEMRDAEWKTRAPALHGDARWPFLKGTSAEVRAIGELWKSSAGSLVLEKARASEATVRRAMPRCRYVHLATHGFFASEELRSTFSPDIGDMHLDAPSISASAAFTRVATRNPLILSGVVLAGANRPAQTDSLNLPTGEDGIFTAEEVVNLDLRDTELVVLSACDTGLGKVGGGEGVFGLQRAFRLAGARSVVASLWKVDDDATRVLMEQFYRNLWEKKMAKLEALRQAQLTVMRKYDLKNGALHRGDIVKLDLSKERRQPDQALPPYYWAAFVLSGDWR